MTDENIQEYKDRIAELEKELEEAKASQNNDETFDDLKKQYEEIIEKKNDEIANLNKTVEDTKKKVNNTVDNLNDEIQAKLDANEKYQKLLATVEELEKDKAEATVDRFIQEGKLLPAQKELAMEFCLNDTDKFIELYNNAQPVIEVKKQKSKKISADVNRLVDYFKN